MKPLAYLTLSVLTLFGLTNTALAMTAPDDLVSIFTLTHIGNDGADFDFKTYQKKFKDLKLDKKTTDFIRTKTAELDKSICMDKNPLCMNRLISVRILDGSDVQRLVIGNKLGEIFAWDSSGESCWTSLTGNAEVGYCGKSQ